MGAELPRPILNPAALFAQRLLMSIKSAKPGSAAEDLAVTKWTLSFQLIFRQTLTGEKGWITKAGRLEAMKLRLLRAQREDFAGLWNDMLDANSERERREEKVSERRNARQNGIEQKRRLRRTLRLAQRALYGKAVKALAQDPTLDPATPGMTEKLQALHPLPVLPIAPIPEGELPPKPRIAAGSVLAAVKSMDRDTAAGPDKMGVRWLELIAHNELRAFPDFSGLELPQT